MPSYIYKDNIQLAFDANKKRLRTEAAVIYDAIVNEALGEMTKQFNIALARGDILEIGGSREEMKGFLRVAAQRELGVGDAVQN